MRRFILFSRQPRGKYFIHLAFFLFSSHTPTTTSRPSSRRRIPHPTDPFLAGTPSYVPPRALLVDLPACPLGPLPELRSRLLNLNPAGAAAAAAVVCFALPSLPGEARSSWQQTMLLHFVWSSCCFGAHANETGSSLYMALAFSIIIPLCISISLPSSRFHSFPPPAAVRDTANSKAAF